MKTPSLPVLALEHFSETNQQGAGYYIERLEDHRARFPAVSLPHAHSFYLLLYVTQGQGTHTIDLVTYELRPGGLYFLVPGQAHSWVLSADAQGYILFFSAAFYQRQYPADRLARYPFFDPAQAPVLFLPPTESVLRNLLAHILEENSIGAANRDEVVGAYVYLLLELAGRSYGQEGERLAPSHGLQQVRAFSQLLDAHFRTEKTVRFYADRLALTANHLNALCRRLLNQTASDLIHERVITEAQRRLVHSADTVGQVADALGFEDPSYFTRYFKKYVGHTPEAFRQLQPAH
ncbi:AraC family transcriptional regulator [Hymenobacter properus]|uniref:Helix-turn-helix domain-containing protein n=1 Tax=Hymenobacter properus TaxID=2791026 RepID=A0A931BNV2_9BACT|nr:AraC family transcriptional regulator [Hymenobacter properus]MBF9142855.1 helix-turn-helix domain-containing protein [Hymenobacter properus]MBR7721664.1 helix-turn-helix domain-containing protein [Microvirga sp. SRT04]